jgi:hypothetical protein
MPGLNDVPVDRLSSLIFKESMARELQIDEDLSFNNKNWKAERIGWTLLLIFVLSSFLGAFGPGIATRKTIESDFLSMEYDPITRDDTETVLSLLLKKVNPKSEFATLWVSREYTDNVQSVYMNPEPEHTRADLAGTTYEFLTQPNSQELAIRMILKPKKMLNLVGKIGPSPDRTVEFNHFVYP